MRSCARWFVLAGFLSVASCSRTERDSPSGNSAAGAETASFTSSFLQAAEYNAGDQSLTIHFVDGSVYKYTAVPANVFGSLRSSGKDAGTFFNDSIRSVFRYQRLAPPRPRAPQPAAGRNNARTPTEIPCPSVERMPKQPVRSVVLDSASYDTPTRCLVLYFDSKHVYRYGDVPSEVYRELFQSRGDPGKYFNSVIRKKYRSQRIR